VGCETRGGAAGQQAAGAPGSVAMPENIRSTAPSCACRQPLTMASMVLRGSAAKNAIGERQLRRVARQRRPHQVETGQDQPAAKQAGWHRAGRRSSPFRRRPPGRRCRARRARRSAPPSDRHRVAGMLVGIAHAAGLGAGVQERDLAGRPARRAVMLAATSLPATLQITTRAAGHSSAASLNQATSAVASTPLSSHRLPSWTPHLMRLLPASMAMIMPPQRQIAGQAALDARSPCAAARRRRHRRRDRSPRDRAARR
jgi:hypothetical protein